MSKLIILCGISGSGKSTYAKKLVEDHGYLRICRDDIRQMLFGYTEETISEYYKRSDMGLCEKQVTDFVKQNVTRALDQGKTVVIDQTNLAVRYLNEWKKYDVPVEYHLMERHLDVCIDRDLKRTRKVGRDIIKKQYSQWLNIKEHFKLDKHRVYTLSIHKWYPEEAIIPYEKHDGLPHCIIVDMDGTLSYMNGRSPFDGSRVDEDGCHEHVRMVVNNYKARFGCEANVFVFSAREGTIECMSKTIQWLYDNNVEFDYLQLRKEGDHRRDWIVKYEMFNELIRGQFNIKLILEDRAQMLRYYKKMNVPVLSNNTLLEEY